MLSARSDLESVAGLINSWSYPVVRTQTLPHPSVHRSQPARPRWLCQGQRREGGLDFRLATWDKAAMRRTIGKVPQVVTFLREALAGGRLGYPYRARTSGTQRREDYDGLHACAEP